MVATSAASTVTFTVADIVIVIVAVGVAHFLG